ncbi:heterokaryon incompatibility protein-domain-containing protein, partial [Epithele typhae]|uniref:heterokaryon incompatibility protein-domain-containing protein n=1 Tax=Epithele typhae TaxID=378194 RepID=UPI002007D2A7
MRLLETTTGKFFEVSNHLAVPYAILSHTWEASGEQSYDELRRITSTSSFSSVEVDTGISDKIKNACALARAHGHRYLWIDSCCIDKSSSAELSEAINSMYAWYRDASICYSFLADVDVPAFDAGRTASGSPFHRARWFTRGWTLQELIAPRALLFLSACWSVLGTKASLADAVEAVTGVPRAVLTHRLRVQDVSVAQRMAWAARRRCTRVEDEAYALMGLFDITMPTLYGEGRRAFVRLQREVLACVPDQSVLAW